MVNQSVTIQLTLGNSELYLDGIGEMLSRHLTELCSLGNFGDEFASNIYRSLADKLDSSRISEIVPSQLSQVVRKGFDLTMFGPKTSTVSPKWELISEKDPDEVIEDNIYEVTSAFRKSPIKKEVDALVERAAMKSQNEDSPIEVFVELIRTSSNKFQEAQDLLLNVASANNIKVENDYEMWKKNAPIREVIDLENKIVFIDQELTDYYWGKLLERCVRASILDATEDEIDSFVAAYSILPRHFQIDSLVPIDNSYRSWVNEIHCELEKALAIGLTIEEIRLFGIERGLPEMGVTIRNRVDYLETLGRVSRGKKNGKLLFRIAGEAIPETVMERTDAK